jgi:hypothetical protein
MEINDGHYLEVMDRLHIVMENLDNHLLQHPLVEQNPKVGKLIDKSIGDLFRAYQLVGNLIPENK